MSKLFYFLCFLLALPSFSSSMELTLPEKKARQGETVRLAINARNFKDIVSIQFSINWDMSVIQYSGFEAGQLIQLAIGDVSAHLGQLRVSWFDVEGFGVNLPDSSAIVYLDFDVVGKTGQSTDISITGVPLEIQIFQGVDGSFTPVDLSPQNGRVEIVEAVSVSAQVGQVACFGGESGFIDIQFSGNPEEYQFSWAGPDGFSSEAPSLSEISAGEYQLLITDQEGNSLIDTSYIITAPLAQLAIDQIETTETGCGEQSGQASLQVSGGTPPYQFDIGSGAASDPQFDGLAAGSYTATVTDANTCQSIQNFLISSSEVEAVDLGPDEQLCEGEQLQLDAGEHQSYSWSTGASSSSITVSESGSYQVTVTDGSACVSTDTVNLIVVPEITLTAEQNEFQACPGEPIILRVTGGQNYEWFDSSATLLLTDPEQPIATPQYTTQYRVVSSNACSADTASFLIVVTPLNADAGADTCIAPGATVQLNATGGLQYQWAEGNYELSDYNVANPTTEIEDSTTFVVVITDENFCRVVDSVTVLVAADPLQFVKRINLLTPNGDDKNDRLEFEGIEKYGTNTLTVYNRWGDVVFQKVNYMLDEVRFEGYYNGKALPAGTYYYVLAFRTAEIKQALTILRN